MDTIHSSASDSNPVLKYSKAPQKNWLPFEKARAFVQELGFSSQEEWRDYCASGNKPPNIPSRPDQTYSTQWKNWGDWLGTGYIATKTRKYRSFEKARAYVHTLNLKNWDEWSAYCKSGHKPPTIPTDPRIYKTQFQGYGDWLGTGVIATSKREYLPFEEARNYARELGLKSIREWTNHCKSGQKPESIPTNPWQTYEDQFIGMGDWLGTGAVAHFRRVFLPFEEARAFVQSLGLRNQQEWGVYYKSKQIPMNIPTNPAHVYKGQFKSLGDWLGTGTIANQHKYTSDEEREWHRRANKKAADHRREARKKAVTGTYTSDQIQSLLKRQKYKCYYASCGFAKFKKQKGQYIYHIDHTFPISRVAGTDIPANGIDYIVLACPSCNERKNKKFPWEFFEGGRLL